MVGREAAAEGFLAWLGGLAAPGAVAALLDHGLRFVDIDAPGFAPEDAALAGLAPGFGALLGQGYGAYAAAHRAALLARRPGLEPVPTGRMLDVAYTLAARAKLVLCPFSGEWVETGASLGTEAYWHGVDGRAVLVCQFSEPIFPNFDTVWVLPDQGLVLFASSQVPNHYVRYLLGELLGSLAAAPGQAATILQRGAAAATGLVELNAPHFGHYVWNNVSALGGLLGPGALAPDFHVSRPGACFFAPVTELLPELSRQPQFQVGLEPEMLALAAEQQAVLAFGKDMEISSAIAGRVLGWATRTCPPAGLAMLRQLRAAPGPLVLLGLRLGNRAWLEQAEGLVALAEALAARPGGASFVLDGMVGGLPMGWTHQLMSLDAEMALAAQVMAGIRRFAPCESVVGASMAESLVACDLCDIFVAPGGSGLARYKWLANKPGVLLSNRVALDHTHPEGWGVRAFEHHREGGIPSRFIAPEAVRDVPAEEREGLIHANFSLDWRVVAVAAEEVLAGLG